MIHAYRANQIRATLLAFGIALVASFALGAILSDHASAQGLPICEDYPDRDICIGPVEDDAVDGDQGPGGGFGGNNPFGDGDGDGNRDGSGDSDGKLPFTGYPVSGLILLLLVLLATGLAIRGYIAIRERFGRGSPPLA